MNVIIDKKYNWQHSGNEDLQCWYIGSEKAVKKFISFCQSNPNASSEELKEKLYNNSGNYAVIVEQGNRLIATVDKIRSYPIFYVHEENTFAVSNSARALRSEYRLFEIDELSLLEFRMAGYVTGRETLYKSLYQLQAGEFQIWNEDNKSLERDRYYIFWPKQVRWESEDVLIEELEEITNKIFKRVIEEANGRQIWVPLSGGYDSRLIVCKLKELGYDNLQTYSYGLPGNYEAKRAKKVAEDLGLPWSFFPLLRKKMRQFFWSEERKRYWDFADGFCSIPIIQDISTLLKIRKSGDFSKDAIIINGQSGDFITGGHIPEDLIQDGASMRKLLEALINEHMSLWSDQKTSSNILKIEKKILALIDHVSASGETSGCIANDYEYWEWQERQCKYVVNQQRMYDYLELSWELPLWQGEYLHFWGDIPIKMKVGQKLYVNYLRKYNYKKVFTKFGSDIWRWPGWPGTPYFFLSIAHLFRLIGGNSWKEKFYKYASYFSHYGCYYGIYGFKHYLKLMGRARNPVSFYVDTWIKEVLVGNVDKEGLE